MTTDTSAKIIEYIKQNTEASPKDLYNLLGISPRAVFKQLNTLIQKNILQKVGKPPKVYYVLAKAIAPPAPGLVNQVEQQLIDENFYFVSPIGEEKIGYDGFQAWCAKQDLDIIKTAHEYALTWEKYNAFKKNGLIDGMHKLYSTFKDPALDKLFYLDFYAIERFGKTRLGQLLLLAKSTQNKQLITTLIRQVAQPIQKMIKEYVIDAVGFIPPTVKRETQFMNELKKRLPINQKHLSIIKARTNITVAQKTLNKLQDRIDNAQATIIVEDKIAYNNILLIDDAVGSGATLNETAAQIKQKKLCRGQIIGLAIVGSFKGFDVISEV